MEKVPYEAHGKTLTLLVCSECNYDTFDKDAAKAHEESGVHAGPTSEVPK
jgi:hypothetical protein